MPALIALLISATLLILPVTAQPHAGPGSAQTTRGSIASASVPAEYADLYAFLREKIAGIDKRISAHWKGEHHDVTFAAELLAANGNQGENLFRPQNWDAVLLNLDRLQFLGARGVKVGVKYKREKRQMVETIVREIRPTYITVENEPTTQSQNTRLRFTVQSVADIMEFVLRGLDKQGALIGAGAGTWEDVAYITRLAAIDRLDYIDLHLYPLNLDYAERLFNMAGIARAGNKRIIIGEAWLYKARDTELTRANVANAPSLFARDVFSFWEPLDVEFLTTVGRVAHYLKVDFVAFFWSRHFYGYLDYTGATRSLPPAALFRLVNRTAAGNMLADPPRPTETGRQFQKLTKASD